MRSSTNHHWQHRKIDPDSPRTEKLKVLEYLFCHNKLLFLTMTILAISCSQDQEYQLKKVKYFPINIELKSKVVEFDTMPGCPDELLLAGEYLVLIMMGITKKNTFMYKIKIRLNTLRSLERAVKDPMNLFIQVQPFKQLIIIL